MTTYPDRVLSAIPGGYGWNRRDTSGRRQFMDELADSLEQGRGFGPLFRTLTPVGQEPAPPEQMKAFNAMLMSMNDTKALAGVARGWRKLTIPEDALRSNRVPTLLLIGSRDPLKGGVDALDGVMANLEIHVIDGADHLTTTSHPDYTAKLFGFLAKHRGGAAAPAKEAAVGK